jgi:hypothetical protein
MNTFWDQITELLPAPATDHDYHSQVVDNMRTNDLKVQEIRILLHLKHCNIIEMRDFYTSNAQLCIVMDYADGGDLRGEIVMARNKKATIPEEIISVWIIQVNLQTIFLSAVGKIGFTLARNEA